MNPTARVNVAAELAGKSPLEVARYLVGKREVGKNAGPYVAQVLGESEADAAKLKLAWCAAQAWRFLEWGGVEPPGNFWLCRSVAQFRAALLSVGALIDVEDLQPGDLVGWRGRNGSDTGGGNHMGIVDSRAGVLFRSIEGNAGDQVARRVHTISDPNLWFVGRWPLRESSRPKGCALGA